MRKPLAVLAIGFLAASPGFAAEARSGKAVSAPLQMEELEVRGLREKPGILYLPVPTAISQTTPVRYDLFLEDMARPVRPMEIVPESVPGGRMDPEGEPYD